MRKIGLVYANQNNIFLLACSRVRKKGQYRLTNILIRLWYLIAVWKLLTHENERLG